MIHLVFLAPYEELLGKIEQVFQERSDRDEISCEIMADQFNNDLAAALHGDAIISRGFTALKLKRLGIPYAELKTTGYDVIAAVDNFGYRCLSRSSLQGCGIRSQRRDGERRKNVPY